MNTYEMDRDDLHRGYARLADEVAGYRQPFLRGSQFQRAAYGGNGDRTSGMNVSDGERWASIAAGVGMLALAARRRPLAALAVGTLGAGLIARGLAGHCPVYGAAHHSSRRDTKEALGGAGGVLVHKVMTINRPLSEVYRFWRDFSNLPHVMRHLHSVTPLGNGRSHWVARAPAGFRVEWDAEIINEEENRVIGWRSLEHADVVSAGSVNFRRASIGGDATEIAVRLQYEPPAGKLGALVASLFGEEPSQQIDDDLRRVKQFLETGEVATTKGQTSGRAKRSQKHDVPTQYADQDVHAQAPMPQPDAGQAQTGQAQTGHALP